MEYYGHQDKDGPVTVAAFGAYLTNEGKTLRCPVLIVKYGHTRRDVVLVEATQKEKISVVLPENSVGHEGHCRVNFVELEVVE